MAERLGHAENREKIQTFKELHGVIPVHNEGAALVQATIGIKYPEIPKSIEVSGLNAVVLAFQEWRIAQRVRAHADNPYKASVYSETHNTVFLGGSNLDIRHRSEIGANMQALLSLKNPDLLQTLQVKMREDPEKWVVQRAVLDGISLWGFPEVAARNEGIQDPNILSQIHAQDILAYVDSETSMSGEQDLPLVIDLSHAVMEQVAHKIGSGMDEIISEEHAFDLLGNIHAVAGAHFLTQAVETLEKEGESISSALEAILHKPPASFDQLQQADTYALSLPAPADTVEFSLLEY